MHLAQNCHKKGLQNIEGFTLDTALTTDLARGGGRHEGGDNVHGDREHDRGVVLR